MHLIWGTAHTLSGGTLVLKVAEISLSAAPLAGEPLTWLLLLMDEVTSLSLDTTTRLGEEFTNLGSFGSSAHNAHRTVRWHSATRTTHTHTHTHVGTVMLHVRRHAHSRVHMSIPVRHRHSAHGVTHWTAESHHLDVGKFAVLALSAATRAVVKVTRTRRRLLLDVQEIACLCLDTSPGFIEKPTYASGCRAIRSQRVFKVTRISLNAASFGQIEITDALS